MIDQKTKKKFEKKPIIGTKYTIAISSAKGGVGKSTFAIHQVLKKVFLKRLISLILLLTIVHIYLIIKLI